MSFKKYKKICYFTPLNKLTALSVILSFLIYGIDGSAQDIGNNIFNSDNTFYLAAAKKRRFRKRRVKRNKPEVSYPEIRTDFISLGGGYIEYDWQAGSFEATDKGKYGIAHTGIQFKVSYLLLGLSVDYTELSSDYKGQIPTGQTVNGKLDTLHADMKYRMGFSYSFSERFHLLLPYTGLQYKHWRKKGRPSGFKTDERYEWFQAPLGIFLQIQLFRGFVIGLDLSGGVTLGGMATIFTSKNRDFYTEKVPEYSYPIFQMENGWFYRGEMPLEFYLGKRFGLEISPWYERVKFGIQDSLYINTSEIISLSEIEIISYGVNLLFKIYL
jgi:hypothetical protein